MNEPMDFELSPLDIIWLTEYTQQLEAERACVAHLKEMAQVMNDLDRQAKEALTIEEAPEEWVDESHRRAVQENAAYYCARYPETPRSDRGGNAVGAAIIWCALFVAVVVLSVWHEQIAQLLGVR